MCVFACRVCSVLVACNANAMRKEQQRRRRMGRGERTSIPLGGGLGKCSPALPEQELKTTNIHGGCCGAAK